MIQVVVNTLSICEKVCNHLKAALITSCSKVLSTFFEDPLRPLRTLLTLHEHVNQLVLVLKTVRFESEAFDSIRIDG